MKSSQLSFIVLLFVLFVMAWWFWKSKRVPPVEAPAKTAPTSSANTVAPNGTTSQPGTPAGKPALTSEMLALEKNPKVVGMEKMMAAINASPINVYGKVIDQFDQPVVGAKVNGGTLLMISFERSGGEEFSTVTDVQGRFSFTGLHGARFGLRIEKAGYKYDTQLNVNWWNNYKPDPDNPAIFHMWKLQGAEPLVSDSKFYGIKPDGRFYTIDLINGTKTEGTTGQGDLVVQIMRPAQIQQGQKFDWSFTMQANGGGFLETTDAYLNEAPESGYQSQYTVTMSANDPNWQEEVQDKTFYLESRNGAVYGQMRVTIIPNYNDTSVFKFESYVNPSSSRDLEIDPTKVTKAGHR